MNIYVYSDESGVFDKEHNDITTFLKGENKHDGYY